MSDVKNKSLSTIDQLVSQPYKYGFETEIEKNSRVLAVERISICFMCSPMDRTRCHDRHREQDQVQDPDQHED